MDAYILVTGNPVMGFSYYGPFDSTSSAIAHADGPDFEGDGDWWVAPLHPVDTE